MIAAVYAFVSGVFGVLLVERILRFKAKGKRRDVLDIRYEKKEHDWFVEKVRRMDELIRIEEDDDE